MEQGPIFLAGVDRTGIGFLGELLEFHPRIAMTRRTNFWSYYNDRFGDLSDPENFERCLTEIQRNSRMQRLQPQPDRLRQEFSQGEQSYPRLFALLCEHNMERLGKVRWGDKSLGSERYADTILTAYPTAKMIHIIRDPRDRYASQFSHRGVGRGKLGAGVALWRTSVRLAERNQRQYGERYKIVQYETLVHKPEVVLRDICDFIGETYSPEMLMMENGTDTTSESDNVLVRSPRPIWTTSIGRFRTILSKKDIAFIQACTSRQMARYGYALEPLSLTGSARLRFNLIDFPLNYGRMMLREPWARLKNLKGRKPSARRLDNDG